METTYTYDRDGLVIRKGIMGGNANVEEIIERDAHGSCVQKKVVKDGKVVHEVINEITYGNGTTPSIS